MEKLVAVDPWIPDWVISPIPGLHIGGFASNLATLTSTTFHSNRSADAYLWGIASGLALVAFMALLLIFGWLALNRHEFKWGDEFAPPLSGEAPEATIYLEASAPTAAVVSESARFARTAADQASDRPEHPSFIGERDTRATSDAVPDPKAERLPSQHGVPLPEGGEIETTESDYQDGSLTATTESLKTAEEPAVAPARAAVASPAPSASSSVGESQPRQTKREALVEGPNPVDVMVPRETAAQGVSPRPAEAPLSPEAQPKVEESPPPTPPKPATGEKPFKGYQRKTAVVGSISRTGRSALDVENSALGRYQSTISRAVELEWQRNCVRHRDFITPGYLTVRFFVEPSGKVRSVQFVGDMETGEIQKGFTLNSIRDAEIPAMPKDIRAEYQDDPLELIFRFYF